MVEYEKDLEEEYIYIHNEGFAGKGTAYDNEVHQYDEEENIIKTFLAIYEGEFVGMIDLVKVEGEEHTVEIDPISVLPDHRGKGVGSMLLKKGIDWTRIRRYKRLVALVSSGADDFIHDFFKKNDFMKTCQIFASKSGEMAKVRLDVSSPFPEDDLKGHVFVYELSIEDIFVH